MQAHPVIRYDAAIQASGRPMNEVLTLLLELYRGASERPFEEFQEFAIRLVQPALREQRLGQTKPGCRGGTHRLTICRTPQRRMVSSRVAIR